MLVKIKPAAIAAAKFAIHILGNLLIKPFLLWARKNNLAKLKADPKILYVSLAFRGDLILTFPALKALKKRFPKSTITLWVREFNHSLAELTSDIDKVETYDKFNSKGISIIRELFPTNRHKSFIEKIKQNGYDLYIDDSGYVFSALVGYLAKIPLRIGRNQQGFGFLSHFDFPYDFNGHLVRKKIKILRPLNIQGKNDLDILPHIIIPRSLISSASRKTQLDLITAKYFTCFPCAGWKAKNWEVDKYAYVMNEFASYSNLFAIILGAEQDRAFITEITNKLRISFRVFVGNLDISESAALISKAAIHFGVDSVGSHLAAASNVKSLTIFGPTNPMLIGCLSVRNIAVLKKTDCTPPENKIYCCRDAGRSCPYVSCMRDLRQEDVLAVLKDLWDGKINVKVIKF